MKRKMNTLALLLCLCVLHASIADAKLLKKSVATKGRQIPLISDVPEDLSPMKPLAPTEVPATTSVAPAITPSAAPAPTTTEAPAITPSAVPAPTTTEAPAASSAAPAITPSAAPAPTPAEVLATTPTMPSAQPASPSAASPVDLPGSNPSPPPQSVQPQLPAPTTFVPTASNPTLRSTGGPKYKCVRKMGDDCVISFPDIQWSSRVVFEGPSSSINPVPYAATGAAAAAAADASATATLKADERVYQQTQQYNHQITESMNAALSGLQQLQAFTASHGGSVGDVARAIEQLQLTMRSVQIALDSVHLATGVVTSRPTRTPLSTTPVALPPLGSQAGAVIKM